MTSAAPGHKPIAVYGAIAANLLVAIVKFIAAAITGSSAMLSEGIHSIVDTGNQLLLLLGIKRSARPADEGHPFGHGKEIYFWGLIVAMLLFSLGGGMSVYEGITHLQHSQELTSPFWSYVVLAAAFVFEGISLYVAVRELIRSEGFSGGLIDAMRRSKDPSIYVVVAEDTAALAGILIAAIGIFLTDHFQNPVFDGAASILIGIMMGFVAIFLAHESKGLLLGESASRHTIKAVKEVTNADPAVKEVVESLTMHFGPNQVLLAMKVRFKPDIPAAKVAEIIDNLKVQINQTVPEIRKIFIEAE